jgi:hypothetical protein
MVETGGTSAARRNRRSLIGLIVAVVMLMQPVLAMVPVAPAGSARLAALIGPLCSVEPGRTGPADGKRPAPAGHDRMSCCLPFCPMGAATLPEPGHIQPPALHAAGLALAGHWSPGLPAPAPALDGRPRGPPLA